MNAVRKTILFLAAAVILLGIPPTAASENDDTQAPPAVNLAAGPSAISPSARGTPRPRVLLQATVAVAPCAASFRHVGERVCNFAFCDCRSNLQYLCLLRC
jgi:hypothetical protein